MGYLIQRVMRIDFKTHLSESYVESDSEVYRLWRDNKG